MAETFILDAQVRTVLGKQVKALRRAELIPAVIYGAGGETLHISCPRRPLEIVLQKASGTHVIAVTVNGGTHNAIVREVQRDKVKRTLIHVDFLRVDLTKKLRTEVPLLLVNIPKLAGELQLSHILNSVEVECLPTDIPAHIEVNIAGLTKAGNQITLGDLPQIPGVELVDDLHEVIARIESLAPQTAEEEAADGGAVAEPEVIEKGKKEEEDF